MNIKIYVATHKRYDLLLKINNPIYIPIHCGKAIYIDPLGAKGYLPILGDNTGDNISNRNLNYCELTAIYWAWKNDNSKPDDIIGFNHYRRYFSEPTDDMTLLGQKSIEEMLSNYDFIVNGCGTEGNTPTNPKDSAYEGYKSAHCIKDLDNALEGTKILFPDLYNTINFEIKNNGAMCLCNMFITRKKYLDEYCEYLFSVLNYVDSKIDWKDGVHEGYGGRVFGFLGERLLRPWLIATNHSGTWCSSLNWEAFSGYKWE